jgi:O-antigen ligase
MFAARPLTGVGIECFSLGHSLWGETRLQMSPHNSIIQIAAELGLGGLILFMMIVVTSLRAARDIRRRAREDLAPESLVWLASAIEISFIGFLVSAFFLTHAYSAIFCFLAGMSAALVARCRGEERRRIEAEGEIEYA